MRRVVVSLFALLLLSFTGGQAFAQEKPASDPRPANEAEQPKNEVERALEEAKSRGQRVLTGCFQDCEGREIPDGLEVGRAVELVKPNMPEIARKAHASGEVVVSVVIDVDGSVIAAYAISGHPLLMATSVAAARATRFTPTTFLGEPMKVTGVIKYNFVSQ